MKKRYWLMGVVPMLAFSNCTELYGQTNCSQGTLDHLNANGMVSLTGTEVLGHAMVKGQLLAQGASFKTLAIHGTAELNDVNTSKDLTIKGFVVMKHTNVGNVHATANRIELHDTNVGDINMLKHDNEPQTVILSGHTKVSGNIYFEQGNGRVVKGSNVSIHGKIIGGNQVN
ncbi:MAG: hypothetical protein P8L77_02690 [Gammaproteobacteria bacterium]|nr:hypothetical protein [Gammaproteobacteria bacterium]